MTFDCDGVLVDSEPIAVRTHVALGAELGWALGESDVMNRFPEPLVPEAGGPLPETHREMHARAVDEGLTQVDGIAEALDGLEAAGFGAQHWCIASSGSHEKMRHTLGRVGLHQRFEGRTFSAHATAGSASRRPAPPECGPSDTPAASRLPTGSRVRRRSSSPTCADCPPWSRHTDTSR